MIIDKGTLMYNVKNSAQMFNQSAKKWYNSSRSSKEKRTSLEKINTVHERNNSYCEDPFVLPLINDITDYSKIEKSILMIETSGNPWLIARYLKFAYSQQFHSN